MYLEYPPMLFYGESRNHQKRIFQGWAWENTKISSCFRNPCITDFRAISSLSVFLLSSIQHPFPVSWTDHERNESAENSSPCIVKAIKFSDQFQSYIDSRSAKYGSIQSRNFLFTLTLTSTGGVNVTGRKTPVEFPELMSPIILTFIKQTLGLYFMI